MIHCQAFFAVTIKLLMLQVVKFNRELHFFETVVLGRHQKC